jgi:hypothetical protein
MYSWFAIAALIVVGLACNLPGSSPTETLSDEVNLQAAEEIFDEAGVSLEAALVVSPDDQRGNVLAQMGPPDAFTIEWQELEGQVVQWEEWSYFDFQSRFDFVDGELLWTLDINPAPDGSIFAHAYDPRAFNYGMTITQVEAILPEVEITEFPLEEAEIPGGLLLAGDQILMGEARYAYRELRQTKYRLLIGRILLQYRS